MSSQEASSTPFTRSFTVQEFDRLLTSALDIDRVPLPLINFAPSRSSPASLEWTADLDSYIDDQHDIDALEQPFLNLDDLSIDLTKPQSPPTLLRKVKSRATALVRRGKDDSHLPPVTEIDFEDFADDPSPPVRVRTTSLPLSVFSSRKSKGISPSLEPHVRRPCRSFIEDSVPQHHFWRRSLALHSPSISFGPRPTPRLQTSSLQFEDTDDQPASPLFLNPRTPPMPVSGLPLYEPSSSYLGTRRGSTTSTNSSLSSVIHPPSVKSNAGTFTSRITSSLSRLAQRSRSKISLTLDTEIEFADSPPSTATTSHSPRTPLSPFTHIRPSNPVSPVHQSAFPDLITEPNTPGNDPFPMDRVLTPEVDPFARANSCVSNSDTGQRSLTPTPHIFVENDAISYTFPSQVPFRSASRAASISEKTVATKSAEESSRLVRSKYVPPPFPPPSHPPPKFPPPVRPLPPTPSTDNAQADFSDWTLNLDSPTGSHPKGASYTRGSRSAERKESSKPFLGLLSPRNRPSSPFPLLKGSSSSKSLLQALAPSVTYRTRSSHSLSTDGDTFQSQKRHVSLDTEESSDSSATLRASPLDLDRPRTITPPPSHKAPSLLLSPGPYCTELSAAPHEFAVTKDDSSPIQPAVWRASVLYDDGDEDLPPFGPPGGVRHRARDSLASTMSSDRASFHTAISRMSILSIGDISGGNTVEGAYSWNNVHAIPSSGIWDIWIPGSEGYFEGEENSQIKLTSETWNELMGFCFAHEGVVVRKRSIPGDDEVTVLNVEAIETPDGGLEMVLTLSRSRMRVETHRQNEGASTILAFSSPLPTTLGLLAHHCRGACVGQGVGGNNDTNIKVF
ncbi:hypothetical protein BDM02DRAFT_3182087 [Thelephora ganbajun]|uniref:Uncharacterized protein n=1 Tax=Thelephora ganbajun TaxID=370292 RepID=A0ACB6ZXR4_THEGA|nr:hypothetical protein BDM02DRAFT_3182087 [Thelephora ganbajun]